MEDPGEGVFRASEVIESHDLIIIASYGLFQDFPRKGAIADISSDYTLQGFEQARQSWVASDPFREGDPGIAVISIAPLVLIVGSSGLSLKQQCNRQRCEACQAHEFEVIDYCH